MKLAHMQVSVVPVANKDSLVPLVPVFVEGFNGKPWYEQWTEETAREYLIQYYAGKAQVLSVLDDGGNVMVFGVCLPLAMYERADELTTRGASSEAYYISEIVTAAMHQGQGLAEMIVGMFVALARKQYPEIILRTRVDNTPMHKIVTRLGFYELCRYETIDGGVKSPRIVFRFAR